MRLPLSRMSLAEFLAWKESQPERHEYCRGELFAMVGGTARHNRVVLNLAGALQAHLDGSGCLVFAETMMLRLADVGFPCPDVTGCCSKAYAGDELTASDPLLIIEVLSPSTKGCDKRDKFILYRSLPSLREYARIDPSTREVEVFTMRDVGWLLTDQTWSGALTLDSIGFTMPMPAVCKGLAPEEG